MKKRLSIFLFVCIMIPIFSLSAQTGKIAGRVVNKKTGAPLPQANVIITELSKGSLTQEKGRFLLENIPDGTYEITASIIGYEKSSKTITVNANLTVTANFYLIKKDIDISGITVNANRAKKRETPIAFSNVDKEKISDDYTTQDMPQLLEEVPGLFASSTGIGEASINMRGFDADKIQVLINGVPVNDPESQEVYWSNWTGLSSTVQSVQVQRGTGSSLYGSGAFGGSINIETITTSPKSNFILRTSSGLFSTDSKVANGAGSLENYDPYNYNVSLKYESGGLLRDRLNYSLMLEKKQGDSYIINTNYNGYSAGVESQLLVGNHKLNASFIGAPQEHNNVYFKSDPNLFSNLGRNYNRNNTPYQENYYFKPQFSIRDEWKLSENQLLMTNAFVTKGDGGGKYLSQTDFNVETGAVTKKPLFTEDIQNKSFGKHAYYMYQLTDSALVMDGFDPTGFYGFPSYNGKYIPTAQNFFNSPDKYEFTWLNDRISDHFQWGLNTYYKNKANSMMTVVFGGEFRRWQADHIGKRKDFRYFNPNEPDSLGIYDIFQNNYSSTNYVTNMSTFARFTFKPIAGMNIMMDGQYGSYNSEVNENPITIYDIGTGAPTDYSYYATKNMTDEDGNKKFTDDDYKKTYNFFSPKFGINYNFSEYFNGMVNYSVAYKEPKTMQWYSGYDGPDGNQLYTKNVVKQDSAGNYYNYEEEYFYGELKPEQINTLEFGLGYDGAIIDLEANYYISDYKDKIEYVSIPVVNEYYDQVDDSFYTQERDENLTLNAGEARHQGLELTSSVEYYNMDFSTSLTLAKYRWTKMNIDEIFDVGADAMKGKVVPFSPEKMINSSLGYTFKELPMQGKLRVGLDLEWWDDYYASYTNEYMHYVPDSTSTDTDSSYVESSKLPYYLSINANLKYSFELLNKQSFVRLDFNNILNRKKNYSSANVRKDYNRMIENDAGELVPDYLNSRDYLYVTPAPLFNVFLTLQIQF